MLGELTADSSFTRIEEDVRRFWRRNQVPSACQTTRREGTPLTIHPQPLPVAGGSVADQVRLLATTDLLARYHAMRGSAVQTDTGWICHGLSVEFAVERSLGPEIAGYDLVRFSDACRQAAVDGFRQSQALSERLGLWPGPEDACLSLEPQAVGVVWGGLRQLWAAGRLRRDHRVAAVCPRCATPLSSTEAALRTGEVEGQAAWVQLPWDGEPDTYFLAWTPVPWTLVGMVALAIHPEETYVLVEPRGQGRESPDGDDMRPSRLLLAESALGRTLPAGYRRVKRLRSRALRGARYHPVFTFLPAGEGAGRVILSETVPLDRGTGLWPVTPAFDALSLALAQSHGLPVPQLLDDWGALGEAVTSWRGLSPLDAEPLLVEDLQERGLLFAGKVEHRPQSLCPYCETPLLSLARSLWWVETGSGPWLVSRDRAWGVPLPVWMCDDCGDEVCLSGLDDLARRTGLAVEQIDPHRPAIDRLTLPCRVCGGTMRRVPAVVDAAFEAAVLAWSSVTRFGPANVALGLGDQHLGWLGDLAEVAALLGGTLAWEKSLALPASDSQVAWDLARMPSADALRWAAYAGTTPAQAERDLLRPLWRSAVALADRPGTPAARLEADNVLERWLMARLQQTIQAVSRALDGLEPGRAAEALQALVLDLEDWVVPHRPEGGGKVLEVLSRLVAPFVPHLAEAIHRRWAGPLAPSVHLAAWPIAELEGEERMLLADMAHVQRWVELGRRVRAQEGLDPGQPLHRAVVSLLVGGPAELGEANLFEGLLAKMLGVSQVQIAPVKKIRVTWRLSLDLEHGVERDLAPAEIEAVLEGMDAEESARLASELWAGLSVGLEVSGRAITLLPDEVCTTAQAPPGWAAATDAQHLVVLSVG